MSNGNGVIRGGHCNKNVVEIVGGNEYDGRSGRGELGWGRKAKVASTAQVIYNPKSPRPGTAHQCAAITLCPETPSKVQPDIQYHPYHKIRSENTVRFPIERHVTSENQRIM